jgi:hypothetical protein
MEVFLREDRHLQRFLLRNYFLMANNCIQLLCLCEIHGRDLLRRKWN